MASITMTYGVLLATLGFLVRFLTPELGKTAFITGIAGGALCVLWGVVAWAGHKRRVWLVLTLIAVLVVVLIQAVNGWMVSLGGPGALAGALLLTLTLVLTVGMLMYVLHGERTPEFYLKSPADPDTLPRHSLQPGRESARRHQ